MTTHRTPANQQIDERVEEWTAFSAEAGGGNPAGVWIGHRFPPVDEMQRIAADVGHSETAFLESTGDLTRWRVRYFSPTIEVGFCGHATIASAVALGRRHGDNTFHFATHVGDIPVRVRHDADTVTATLTSVETQRRDLAPDRLDQLLDAMYLTSDHLDRNIQPDLAYAGAWHLIVPLRSRRHLAGLHYDFDQLAQLMTAERLTTVQAVWRERPDRFHSRNPFPVGGIVEDPATGAAAAALGGYLRTHRHIEPPADLVVVQGVDMGRPSIITVHVPSTGGINVTGTATRIPSEDWLATNNTADERIRS